MDAAIRSARRDASGRDLQLRLLSANAQPLLSVLEPTRHEPLTTVQRSSGVSAHKAAMFLQTGEEPAFVEVTAFGESTVLPLDASLAAGGGEQALDARLLDDKESDPALDDLEEAEEDDKPRCCLKKFVTPDGRQPTAPHPRIESNGVMHIICRPWTIEATFDSGPDPCKCKCCEYRQYIEGFSFLTVRFMGIDLPWMDIGPALDYMWMSIPGLFDIKVIVKVTVGTRTLSW